MTDEKNRENRATGIISRFASALLLVGAAALALGLASSAESAGARTGFAPAQIPVESPEGGEEETPSDEESAPLSPPPEWSAEKFIQDLNDCARQGGNVNLEETEWEVVCDEHLPPKTLVFFPGQKPNYAADTCEQLRGALRADNQICSGVDVDGTFCLVGSQDAFPCRGLMEHALRCNSYNRPALSAFLCGEKCEDNEHACGNDCRRGGFSPPESTIFTVRNHIGELFRVTATAAVAPKGAHFGISLRFPAVSPITVAAVNGTVAAVSMGGGTRAGQAHLGSVLGRFSCGGLAETYGREELKFTVWELPPQPLWEFYFEGAPWSGGEGKVFLETGANAKPNQVYWNRFSGGSRKLNISSDGAITVVSPRPTIGSVETFVVWPSSPQIAGRPRVTVRVKFVDWDNEVLVPNHCKLREGWWVSSEFNPSFYAAVQEQNIPAVCSHIHNGANVNLRYVEETERNATHDRDYPLGIATRLGNIELVQILLANGADTSLGNPQIGNALNMAAFGGMVEMGKRLLSLGFSPSAQSGVYGDTPLTALGLRGEGSLGDSDEFAKLLLAHGADPNGVNGEYKTFLLVVTDIQGGGDTRAARTLLDAGASLNVNQGDLIPSGTVFANRGIDYYTPVDNVVRNDHLGLAGVFFDLPDGQRPDPNKTVESKYPLIAHARSPGMVMLLDSKGADVNKIAFGHTPLDYMLYLYEFFDRNGNLSLFPNLWNAIRQIKHLGGRCHVYLYHERFGPFCMGMASAPPAAVPSDSPPISPPPIIQTIADPAPELQVTGENNCVHHPVGHLANGEYTVGSCTLTCQSPGREDITHPARNCGLGYLEEEFEAATGATERQEIWDRAFADHCELDAENLESLIRMNCIHAGLGAVL